MTQPVKNQSRLDENPRSAKEWLDALASGLCDEEAFLAGVGELLRKAPDAGWDLLSHVDQYYRRGKLTADAFGKLKSHLQGILVTREASEPHSPPSPSSAPASAAPHAASAPTVSRMAAAPAPRATVEPAPEMRPSRPRRLATGDLLRRRYRVKGLLGRGGMGTVYAAIDQFRVGDEDGEQRVAIKVLHTEVIQRPRLFAELRREFQHLQSLSHPNIVRVHEFDRDGDLAFFTMEYLSGAPLSRVLADADASVLDRPYALAIVRDVGAAVAHAHARGVVHGDLNPGNIFLTDTGEIRVLDFGASSQLHRAPWISEFDKHEQIAVATPTYASCQLLEGEAADARDDVYALACIAYKLLTGNHPFGEEPALQARTLRLSPARPRGLKRRQWSALRAGLHFDREMRPADIRAWLERLDLRAAADRLPESQSLWAQRPARRYSLEWSTLGVAAALIIALCGWLAVTNSAVVASSVATMTARFKAMVNSAAPMRSDDDRPIEVPTESVQQAPRAAAADRDGRKTAVTLSTAVTTAPAAPPPATPAAAPAPAAPTPVMRTAAAALATLPTATAAALPATTAAPPPPPPPPTALQTAATTAPAPPPPIDSAAPPAEPAATAATAATASAEPNGGAPRARIELAADSIDVPPGEDTARIVVRRTHSVRDDVNFTWWTESGTAKPGLDFVPVKSTVEHIESGKNSVSLAVPLVTDTAHLSDTARRGSRSFYVVIDDASDNAALGPRTLTMVTLPGAD